MPPRQPKADVPPMSTYVPPEPAFTVCTCGALMLAHAWVHSTKGTPAHWRALPEPVSPVEGGWCVCKKEGA